MSKTLLLIVVGAIAAVVVIVIVAMALRVVPVPGFIWNLATGAKPPEHSASYYPADTLVYGWLTLAPSEGQFDNSQEIWDRLNEIPEFELLYEEFKEQFEEDVDSDFEDLQEWVGPDMSAAILVDDWDDGPLFALTVGVRNKDAAEDFLDDWLDYMDRSEGAGFESDSYEGFDTWVDEYEDQAYGLSGDLLVFATTEDFLEEVIDGFNGDVEETLADTESFQIARAALTEQRFASLYIDSESTWREVSSEFGLDEEGRQDLIPEWVAFSSAWGDRSMTAELVMPSVLDHALDMPRLESPADVLPEETLLLVSAAFDPDLDNWRESLEEEMISDFGGDDAVDTVNDVVESIEYEIDASELPRATEGSGLDYLIDLGIAVVDDMTGLDLEEDFFNQLQGQVSLAAWNLALDEYGDIDEGSPISLVALLSYEGSGQDELEEAIEKLQEFLGDEADIDFKSVDVGADQDAQIMDIDEDYSPGYVLNDGYLIFAGTEDSLTEVVELQGGEGDSLDSNPEYQRAVRNLPDDRHLLVYVSLNGIIRNTDPDAFEFEDYLDSYDAADDGEFDDQGLLETSIGSAAASYTLGNQDEDGLDRFAAVLTLFPR